MFHTLVYSDFRYLLIALAAIIGLTIGLWIPKRKPKFRLYSFHYRSDSGQDYVVTASTVAEAAEIVKHKYCLSNAYFYRSVQLTHITEVKI